MPASPWAPASPQGDDNILATAALLASPSPRGDDNILATAMLGTEQAKDTPTVELAPPLIIREEELRRSLSTVMSVTEPLEATDQPSLVIAKEDELRSSPTTIMSITEPLAPVHDHDDQTPTPAAMSQPIKSSLSEKETKTESEGSTDEYLNAATLAQEQLAGVDLDIFDGVAAHIHADLQRQPRKERIFAGWTPSLTVRRDSPVLLRMQQK